MGFKAALAYKDVRLCVDEAEFIGAPMVVGSAVREMLSITLAVIGKDADFSEVVKVCEAWAGVENFEEVTRLHAASTRARVFGLTATTPQLPAAAKVLAALRRARPQSRVILGGPHITLVKTPYHHNDLSDRGPDHVKTTIRSILDRFLDDDTPPGAVEAENPKNNLGGLLAASTAPADR